MKNSPNGLLNNGTSIHWNTTQLYKGVCANTCNNMHEFQRLLSGARPDIDTYTQGGILSNCLDKKSDLQWQKAGGRLRRVGGYWSHRSRRDDVNGLPWSRWWFTGVHTCHNSSNVHLLWIHFIVCKLHLNEVDLKKINSSENSFVTMPLSKVSQAVFSSPVFLNLCFCWFPANGLQTGGAERPPKPSLWGWAPGLHIQGPHRRGWAWGWPPPRRRATALWTWRPRPGLGPSLGSWVCAAPPRSPRSSCLWSRGGRGPSTRPRRRRHRGKAHRWSGTSPPGGWKRPQACCGPWSPRHTGGSSIGPGEGLHPLGSGDPIPLQAHTPWTDGASLGGGSHADRDKTKAAPPRRAGAGRPTMMKGNTSPTRNSMVHMSAPQTM